MSEMGTAPQRPEASQGGTSALRRVDARFLLPTFPETAVVMHPAWVGGLQHAAVRVVDPSDGPPPDLVVAPANLRDAARRLRAPMMLLDGRPTGAFGVRAMRGSRRYLPIQTRNGAIVVVDLSHGPAAERALAVATHAGTFRAAAKRSFARAIVRFRLLPPIVPMYTVHSASSTTPALVREAARQAGVEAVAWFLLIEPGADHRRLVFFLFTGRGEPQVVVKFSRLRDDLRKAKLEARGLEAAAVAGASVVEHAPKLLAQFEIGRHHATVQTAIPGQTLGRTISTRGSRRRKLMLIEAVVDWLCEIARSTAHRRGSLGADFCQTIMRGCSGDAARLMRIASSAPAVFQHGDLADGNIIVDGDAFVAVDWELARADGFPLWDFICLTVCTLPLLDRKVYDQGEHREDAHVRHLGDLFRGRAPSSSVFLQRLRSVADASGLDPAVVPEIVTLWFLWYSEQWAGWAPLERFTSHWLAAPDLGMSWTLWRDSMSSS
jgi:Phosphotransferase enzyme family